MFILKSYACFVIINNITQFMSYSNKLSEKYPVSLFSMKN